jgi:hypothetical protein
VVVVKSYTNELQKIRISSVHFKKLVSHRLLGGGGGLL